MDEGELTAEQLEELGRDLTEERARLEEVLKISKDGARPVDLDEPIGRLSRMDAIQQQQMTKANRSAYERKLRQIETALDQLERFSGEARCKSSTSSCPSTGTAFSFRTISLAVILRP